jgi:small subunit ribosomal protein S6e
MPLKLNISEKGKSWKIEVEPEVLSGKSIGEKFDGKILKPELEGYELEITGGTDFAGFPMRPGVEGIGLKRVLFTKGWGFTTKPKGESKKNPRFQKGLRMRKTVRGQTISDKSLQINIKVLKPGKTPLATVFPDQNKAPEPEPKPEEAPKAEAPATETPKAEEKPAEAAAPAA